MSLRAPGRWLLGRPLKLDFAIRNAGAAAASLPGRKRIFGYLLVAQGRTVHYTEKIFHAADQADWPGKLAPGRTLRMPAVDVGKLKAFAYKRGMKLLDGYPARIVAGKPTQADPVGKLAEVLRPGAVKVKYVAYLDRGQEGALSLVGNVLKLTLELGEFARLPPAEQKRLLDELDQRMRKNAFSAMAARADAVRIGRAAVPTLVKVLNDPRAEFFARMWAVTALADIGDKTVAPNLIECLADSSGGVRHVAAYHGLKLRSERFDWALRKVATSGTDPMVTAWAIMGYLKFRKKVPQELLKAGVESKQWRARAAVVETIFRGKPDRSHLPILRRLLRDPKAGIRATAARAIRLVGDRSYQTIDSLISALELEGDNARHALAGTLSALTGKSWTYNTAAAAKEKQEILRTWRQWWAENKASYSKPKTGK